MLYHNNKGKIYKHLNFMLSGIEHRYCKMLVIILIRNTIKIHRIQNRDIILIIKKYYDKAMLL